MPEGKYVVGGQSFRTKAEVKERLSRIMAAGRDATVLAGVDEALALGLLNLREDKLKEIGSRRILRIERGRQPPPLARTRCLWVVLEDGMRLDFSATNKAVRLLRPHSVEGTGGQT